MAELIAIDPKKHAALKVSAERRDKFAFGRHMMPLFVTEIGNAVSQFPVVVSRVSQKDEFALSGLNSFVPGKNAFISDGKWTAGFVPSAMETYPFYLVRPKEEGGDPVIGFDPESDLFGEVGETLLDKKGKLTLGMSRIHAKLKEDIGARIHTINFLKDIHDLGLIRPVNVVVNFVNLGTQKIQGLLLVNEDALHSLSGEQLKSLQDKGYLGPVYAMLFSIFQLNTLIQRHNKLSLGDPIKDIRLEVVKPDNF